MKWICHDQISRFSKWHEIDHCDIIHKDHCLVTIVLFQNVLVYLTSMVMMMISKCHCISFWYKDNLNSDGPSHLRILYDMWGSKVLRKKVISETKIRNSINFLEPLIDTKSNELWIHDEKRISKNALCLTLSYVKIEAIKVFQFRCNFIFRNCDWL